MVESNWIIKNWKKYEKSKDTTNCYPKSPQYNLCKRKPPDKLIKKAEKTGRQVDIPEAEVEKNRMYHLLRL